MIEIKTGRTGTNYMRFGDSQRMYELLAVKTAGPGEGKVSYAFEFRVDNDPNQTFCEFSVNANADDTLEDAFRAGLIRSKAEMAKLASDGSMGRAVEHARDSLDAAMKQTLRRGTDMGAARA